MDTQNTDKSQNNYMSERSQPQRVLLYSYGSIYIKLSKMQTYRKQTSDCLGMGVQKGIKRHKETFEGDRKICIYCRVGLTGEHTYQNGSNCTF